MISEIMTKKVVSINESSQVIDALKLMDDNHYKELPIIDEKNRVLGIITHNSILSGLNSSPTSKVENFIESVPELFEKDSKEQAINLMVNSGITGLPVINEFGALKGFVSDYDLINYYKSKLKGIPLSDINIKKISSLRESSTIGEAKNIMSFNKRDKLPVIDKNGKMIGTVLSIDIMRKIYGINSNKNNKYNLNGKKFNILKNPISDIIVKEKGIDSSADLLMASEEMLKNHSLGLIIVNTDNEPIGAIDRCSILKLLKNMSSGAEASIELVGEIPPGLGSEIKKIIKNGLKLSPKIQPKIEGIKLFIKLVHNSSNNNKVDMRLTIKLKAMNDIIIQKTDYDIILTLMDCIDKANSAIKSKFKK
jgi:CBS-domain-containing membrane protein